MTLTEFDTLTDRQIYDAYLTTYDPDLNFEMGTDPRLIANAPDLVEFYRNVEKELRAGRFKGWAYTPKGRYAGHVTLGKNTGEWELGVLVKPAHQGKGVGVRLALHALSWAFTEDDATWVVARTDARNPNTERMMERMGFTPLMNFHVMNRHTYIQKWRRQGD